EDGLGEHADQGGRQLGTDLLLLLLGEDVDDAVDRARGPGGVQGGEDDVAGLGRLDGGVDRLQVAHFADEHDVGVHAQAAAQGLGEARDVDAHLALVDGRLLVLVVVLDRVFDRDDVPVVVLVYEVDHAGQAGGLAGTGGSGDQQQAARARDQA